MAADARPSWFNPSQPHLEPRVDPAAPHDRIVIQNVAFEPDSIVITWTDHKDVRLAGQATVLVASQQLTLSRTEDFQESTDSLETDVKDLLLDAIAVFVNAPSVADAEAAADERAEDDDEFAGMGE